MSEWKLYLSSMIFIGVTILKLLFPDQSELLREKVVSVIDMDTDYKYLVQQVGAVLTDESVQSVLARLGVREDTVTVISPEREEGLPTVEIVMPTPAEQIELQVSSDTVAAVEAFRRSQEPYSEYAIPANVSYDVLTLPMVYTSPVEGVCSSGFGYRVHPIEQQVLFHYGTDYDVAEGTPILSFADGRVSAVGAEAGYGNYIKITHKDGWETLYAHCSSVSVVEGQQVSLGEEIGKSGMTGRVTGPHLHFELLHDSMYTNPEFFLW